MQKLRVDRADDRDGRPGWILLIGFVYRVLPLVVDQLRAEQLRVVRVHQRRAIKRNGGELALPTLDRREIASVFIRRWRVELAVFIAQAEECRGERVRFRPVECDLLRERLEPLRRCRRRCRRGKRAPREQHQCEQRNGTAAARARSSLQCRKEDASYHH